LVRFSIATRSVSCSTARRRRVFPTQVSGAHGGEDRLGLPGCDVLLRPSWGQLGEETLEPVGGLGPLPRELLAAVD
jgi:hypothetical protein